MVSAPHPVGMYSGHVSVMSALLGRGSSSTNRVGSNTSWFAQCLQAHVPGLLDLSVVTRELLIAEVQGKEAALKVGNTDTDRT